MDSEEQPTLGDYAMTAAMLIATLVCATLFVACLVAGKTSLFERTVWSGLVGFGTFCNGAIAIEMVRELAQGASFIGAYRRGRDG